MSKPAEKGFVSRHPVWTFIGALVGISTVGGVIVQVVEAAKAPPKPAPLNFTRTAQPAKA